MENDNAEKVEEKHDEVDVRKASEENKTLEDDVMQKEDDISEPKSAELKKKHNVLAIVFAFLMLVCAGVAVFFGIKYFEPKEEPEPVTAEKIEKEVKVEIVKETMADDYKEVKDVMKSLTAGVGTDWSYFENSEGLTYKPEGFNTFVAMKFDIEKKVVDQNGTDSGAAEANLETLKNKLENAGFTSLGILPFLGSAGPQIYGYLDANHNITCGIHGDAEWKTNGAINYYYVSLKCAKTDWVWLTEADKNLILELETAYYDKAGKYPSIIHNIQDIKNSQYEPYQKLTVSLGGAAGLFYRTSPDAKWQFFVATQSALDCSDYNTDDLRKAFAGDICYNGSTSLNQSTVQP